MATSVLIAATCGCNGGKPLGEVSGKVTYNGQPLVNAAVEFIPVGEGKTSIGYTDENGDYVLQYTLQKTGALVGRHKVRVRVYPEPGSPPVHIPAEYGTKSTVEFDVKPSDNQFDIALDSSR